MKVVVYEFAGHPVTSAAELRLEVDSMPPGEEAIIKLRRNGAKDTKITAHF